MKKAICLICLFCSLLYCGSKQTDVERIIEDGVEVVLNHQKPYKLANVPSSLKLEKIFSIDSEDDITAEQGITDIYSFDVDSAGSIFLMRPPTSQGDLVYIFSSEGKLQSTFGEFGQGPFELEYPDGIAITSNDEVWIQESPKNKFHVFSNKGEGIYDKILDFGYDTITPLANGKYLIKKLINTNVQTAKYFPITISIYDGLFQELKELDRFNRRPNRRMILKFQEDILSGIEYIVLGKVFKDKIYIANSDRGYEILVYDLSGKLQKKIKKEYTPIPVSEDYKNEYVKLFERMPEYAKRIYFPDNWHAFHSFFLDEAGRLFVMTYEPGNNPGEFIYDIFNEDGLFFHRVSLNILHSHFGILYAKVKGGRLHCLQEKSSGFKELVVYKMIWE